MVGRGRAQRRGHSHRLLLLSQGAALQCSLPGGVGRAVGQGWGAQGARLKGSRRRFFGRSEPGAEAAFFKKWWRKRRSILTDTLIKNAVHSVHVLYRPPM